MSRAAATTRVTSCVYQWLWKTYKSRLVASEVGLHEHLGLCAPWGQRWRVDVAAVTRLDRPAILIEVKGSRADIVRERLNEGKWALDYERLGIVPYLAIDSSIDESLYTNLPETWGVLSVRDWLLRRKRSPVSDVGELRTEEYALALGRVLCMQSLPRFIGREKSQILASLSDAGVDRPWREWTLAPGEEVERGW